MKRILVLALALFLAVGSLAVPSYAAESNNHSMVDLLQAVEYDFYLGGSKNSSSYSSAMNGWVADNTSASWEFSHISSDRYSYQIVTILAWSEPVTFVYEDTYGNVAYGDLIGSSPASKGTYYQYRIGWFNSTGRIRYTANWSSAYTGGYSIISAFGVLNDTVQLTNVSYFGNAILFDNGGGEYIPPEDDDFRFPLSVKSVNNGSFPAVVSFTGPTGSQYYSLDYGEVFLKVSFDDTFKYFDQVTFLIYTSGTIDSVGSRLENSDGSVVDGFDIDLEYCGETQMIFELEENFHRIHCYLVTVDTKGYDFSGKVLSLQACVNSVLGSFIYEYDRGFYFQCASAAAKFDINDVPWYSYFAMWLTGQYSNVIATINGGFSGVYSWYDAFSYSLASWLDTHFGNINTWFNNLYQSLAVWMLDNTLLINNKLDSLFSQLFDILDSSGDNDGFQNQVDDQGDRLDQMDDALSSVTKPALDRVDTNISGIVSDTDLANTAHVYTYIIDDNIMAPALTMVTILAMMSFALFGKR